MMTKQQAKNLFNFTVLDNIIQHFFISLETKNTLRGSRQRSKNYHWIFYVFTPKDSTGGLDTPASCTGGRSFYIFQAECFGK